MSTREQPWSDEAQSGRVVVVTRNPISTAIEVIAGATGREVVVVEHDENGRGTAHVAALGLRLGDALVLCDHDAPDAPDILRAAIASDASYVAMMASRRRSETVMAELRDEGVAGLDKLHVPAGLDTGGRAPGEIALSVVAEIVAESYGRSGGSMRADI